MLLTAFLLFVIIGLSVGLLGGGGSILTTPMLLYVLGFEPVEAIASSLLIVATTSAVALVRHGWDGQVRWRIGFLFGGAGMVGAFVGGQIGARIPSEVLLATFAVMMAATAIAMVRGRRSLPVGQVHHAPIHRILLDGAAVGLLTGMVGAGGGFMVVPALVLLGGLPMRSAVATSLLVVTMKSLAGFAGYALTFGDGSLVSLNSAISFDIQLIVVGAIAAALGSASGAVLSGRIHPERLRVAFGWFVLGMACVIIVQELGAAAIDFASQSTLHLVEFLLALGFVIAVVVFAMRWRVDDAPIHESSTVAGK